ncbi:MAG TPA: amidohydrolase [Polyangia bacterium]|nr:amidohydrolase [Polyangia bacterium]
MNTPSRATRSPLREVALRLGVILVAACAHRTPARTPTMTDASSTAPPAAHQDRPDAQPPADLVLLGGPIYTQDEAAPRADALAVTGGRITFVGPSDGARRLIGPQTRVIDLGGRAVTPGLVDGHCHLYGLGHASEQIALRGLTSVTEIARRVAEAAQGRAVGEWIEGRGWDQNLWSPPEFPTHKPLDQAAPRHPVLLRRIDGHALWANAEAMRRAGVTRQTADPSGGRIVRDDHGDPTGVFIDHAMSLVEAAVPRDTPEAVARKIQLAADQAVAAGLTGIHEMGVGDDVIAVYRRLAAEGRLKLRVYAFLSGDHQIDSLPTRRPLIDEHDRFTLRAVKLYADGALGSRGAALLRPYSDDPKNSGLLLMTQPELDHAARVAAASGWQVGIHAIGDRANRMVLDAFAAAGAGKAPGELRFRVEHAQILDPADIPRFAQLGVIAAMQPTHATSDMPWAGARLGSERLRGAYAWRSLLKTGAHIVGGSDFPVEEVPPLLGLYAAVTRQDGAGHPPGGFLPEERLTLDEALRIYTVEPAWAEFAEARRGRIQVGQDADLTVYDRDLRPDRSLLETRIDYTIVGGRIVHERHP